MTDQQLIDDLTAAKAYMQIHGCCARGPSDSEGRVCIAVAMTMSVKYAQNGVFGKTGYNRVEAMTDLMDKVCPLPEMISWGGVVRRGFVAYNEDPFVTDEDVFSLWDKALAEAGGVV